MWGDNRAWIFELALYAVDVVEIDRGETAPVYDNGAAELSGYPVELTGVIKAGTAGRVDEGLADCFMSVQ